MKTTARTYKGLYIGAAAGVVIFAVTGLLPGSFTGGVIGLNMASALFGVPVEPTLLPRLIVAASMVLGVMVSGFTCVVGCSVMGWAAGRAVEEVRQGSASLLQAVKNS